MSDPRVKSFIQWTKTLKDNVILQKTAVGGHYCYPRAPKIFSQPTADASGERKTQNGFTAVLLKQLVVYITYSHFFSHVNILQINFRMPEKMASFHFFIISRHEMMNSASALNHNEMQLVLLWVAGIKSNLGQRSPAALP